MSDKQYYPDTDNASGSLEQTGQVGQNASPKNHDALKSAWGDIPTCGEDPADSLHTVTAGIINGASPLQFMDRINAGSRQLGNRAFLQFVEKLQKGRPAGDSRETTARGLQGPGQPLTHLAALQRAFGHHDIRGMREHTDSAAASALDMLGAEGYTSGGRMALPGSPDLHVQAHEAAHGVQQAALGDRMPLPDGIGVAGDQYEQQADGVADAVVRGQSAQPILDEMVGYSTQVTPEAVTTAMPVQMQGKKDKKNKDNKPEEEDEHDLPALEAASLELVNPVGNPGPSSPVDGSMEIQQAGMAMENEAAGSSAEDTDSDSDYEDDADELMASYFPAVSSIYNWLTDRVEHIQTAEHGALSLPGIGNTLATVMLGILMVGIGLPLDIFTNMLGAMARCMILLSDVFFGKAVTWTLNSYFRRNPPSAADRARVTTDELPKGPPRGIDWNVSIPEMIAISGIFGYWQAASAQGSLSPSLWLQPWNAARIASIIIKVITDNINYLLQFTIVPQISQRVLQNRLGWGATRSGLFIFTLLTIFNTVVGYILSYLTNIQVAVYLVFQNLIEDDEMTSSEATAALIAYAAAGMLIQVITATLFVYFVLNPVNEKNLVPWLRQFRAIPNRLIRTIAIALASFRNVVINVLSVSLTLGQVAANIIGPLSPRFGQGGACIWPLAVAEVCGGLPADFNETTLEERIVAGEENLTFGQLFAIQLFPWLVGLIGIGVPVAYAIHHYRRTKRTGRDVHASSMGESASVRQGGDSIVGEDAVPAVIPPVPEEMQAWITESVDNSQHSVEPHSGTGPASMGWTVEMLFELLIRQDRLTPTELTRILNQHVANGDITADEAKLIEEMVREEVVLAKEGKK